MKKLAAILVFLLMSLSVCSSNPIEDNDVDINTLFNTAPTYSVKSFDTSDVSPAVNILTGTKDALNFETEGFEDYIYNSDTRTASQYSYATAQDSGKGTVFAVIHDEDEYNKQNSTNTAYVYASVSVDFTDVVDRPVHLYFETLGTKQIGFWVATGSTHKTFKKMVENEWIVNSIDNASVFNGTMKKLFIQYATRPYDCTDTQYYDNIAVYPFYKITYNAYYPDGTSGEATVKYYFDASNLSISDDGTATGLPESYTVEDVEASFFGYELAGWSTQKDSHEPLSQIALDGSDIELYPVWKEAESLLIPQKYCIPGINAFTGNESALNFSAGANIKFFHNSQYSDKSLFTYDLASDPTDSGRGNMLRVTMDTEAFLEKYSPETYIYHTLCAEFDTAITRPGLLMFDTYGSGTVGFWLGAGSTHKTFGTLSSTAAWHHYAQNNADIFTGSVSGLHMQYGINAKTCGNVQYYDNFAFIPYYKVTYAVSYPDGTPSESVESYFLCKNSDLTVTEGGIIRGLPTALTPEGPEISFPGYQLLGWSTKENADTAMTSVPLENKDVTLYPVWQKKAELIPVELTVYLDSEKTVSTLHKLYAGDAFTLPGYYDLTDYTPDGCIPTGFTVDGVLYAPGKTIYLPENDTVTALAQYEAPDHHQYGKLVFLENFDSIKSGTYITSEQAVNPMPVSYINPKWSDNTGHFEITRGDIVNNLYVTDDGTGNNVLKLQKVASNQTWPQLCIYNRDDSPKGSYTLVADVMVPAERITEVSNFNLRIFHTTSSYVGSSVNFTSSNSAKWVNKTITIPIEEGTDYQELYKFQLYISTKGGVSDTYCYIDNISLYVKENSISILISEDKSDVIFFAAGETTTLPYAFEICDSIPEGFKLSGFSCQDKIYLPGEELILSEEDDGLVFEAVFEEISYTAVFDIGDACGTVKDISFHDGDEITLPDFSAYNADFCGWRLHGDNKVYRSSDKFTVDIENASAHLDGNGGLVFEAVYQSAPTSEVSFEYNYKLTDGMFEGATDNELSYVKYAYGAGIIPASDSFDAEAPVTLAELARTAQRLHYRSMGKPVYFETEADMLSDMVSKGICPEYESTKANATFADAAIILANALPNSYYPQIAYNVSVSGLDTDDTAYFEALKLIRAGILPESTDFTAEITYGGLVEAIAKTVQPSLRQTENKRRLYILGDSLTAKTGTIGWPTKLDPLLDGNLEVVNHGIGGINTGTYFPKYGAAYSLYSDMLRNMNPGDYVVIALGTNDSTLWGWGDMEYETSRDNYLRYINEIRSEGGIPIMVCPVGRNNTDENGVYVESDPLIIECMNDVNELYGVNASIINFKDVSFERLGAMTASERQKIYADNVHYTHYGAEVVAKWFGELTLASSDIKLSGLASHFKKTSFDFESEDRLYSLDSPQTADVTSVRIASPSGIRFKASIGKPVRRIDNDVAEYGFIVAISDTLSGNELTHLSDVPFAVGICYNNAAKKDVIYKSDANSDTLDFACVLTGIPETKEGFTTVFTVRSYVKIGESYFYGDTHEDSIYLAAKRNESSDSEYIKYIIELSES